MSKPTNALMVAGGSTLDTEDFELILRALDVFDRFTQNELANEQDAALIDTRSRLLILRAKLRVEQPTGGPTVEMFLLQAQKLLHDADEANHGGHPIDLQRQARELIGAALDLRERAS